MPSYLLRGGLVVAQDAAHIQDVLIQDGLVTQIGKIEAPENCQVVEAADLWVLPGFVDLHTHLREPGRENAETIASGTAAAVAGGYTAVVAMPNTEPPTDSVERATDVLARASGSALCDVIISSCITKGRAGHELVDFESLAAKGIHFFTDDGSGVQDGRLMRQALERSKELNVVIAQHCEDDCLSNGGALNKGETATKLGVSTQAPESEDVMVMRDIALARETGANVHFLHISTAKSVAMVRAAKREGLNVTAEATAHHLSLTSDAAKSGNTVFKVNPPLRGEADRVAIVNGILDGTIDAIATDHAPHTVEAKNQSLEDAPPGMVGLETAFAVVNTVLNLEPIRIAQLFSSNPAKIAKISNTQGEISVGRTANLTIIDPNSTWEVEGSSFQSKSSNTPFEQMKVRGRVTNTFVNGTRVFNSGKVER